MPFSPSDLEDFLKGLLFGTAYAYGVMYTVRCIFSAIKQNSVDIQELYSLLEEYKNDRELKK